MRTRPSLTTPHPNPYPLTHTPSHPPSLPANKTNDVLPDESRELELLMELFAAAVGPAAQELARRCYEEARERHAATRKERAAATR